jgi:hypothetical protein
VQCGCEICDAACLSLSLKSGDTAAKSASCELHMLSGCPGAVFLCFASWCSGRALLVGV